MKYAVLACKEPRTKLALFTQKEPRTDRTVFARPPSLG